MSTTVRCPECGAESPIPDTYLGLNVRCVNCTAQFVATTGDPADSPVLPEEALAVAGRRVREDGGGGGIATIAWPALLATLAALLIPVAAAATFAFLKWEPTPTTRYGVIELSSKSVKVTCFDVYPDRNLDHNFDVKEEATTDTNLGKDVGKSGKFNQEALDSSISAVKEFYDRLIGRYGLPPDRVHIIGSSGLDAGIVQNKKFSADEKTRLIKANHDLLTGRVREATGSQIHFASLAQEERWQIEGVVRKQDRDAGEALFVKLGNSGLRGGYLNSAGILKPFNAIGLMRFAELVDSAATAKHRPFSELAEQLTPDELEKPYGVEFGKDDRFRSFDKVYLIGGIVWVMAVLQHPNERDIYVRLTAKDIEDFAATVRASPDPLKTFEDTLSQSQRDALKVDLTKMREAGFGKQNTLIAGSQLLRALSKSLRLGDKKEIWFHRFGDQAWVKEFITDKSGFDN